MFRIVQCMDVNLHTIPGIQIQDMITVNGRLLPSHLENKTKEFLLKLQ